MSNLLGNFMKCSASKKSTLVFHSLLRSRPQRNVNKIRKNVSTFTIKHSMIPISNTNRGIPSFFRFNFTTKEGVFGVKIVLLFSAFFPLLFLFKYFSSRVLESCFLFFSLLSLSPQYLFTKNSAHLQFSPVSLFLFWNCTKLLPQQKPKAILYNCFSKSKPREEEKKKKKKCCFLFPPSISLSLSLFLSLSLSFFIKKLFFLSLRFSLSFTVFEFSCVPVCGCATSESPFWMKFLFFLPYLLPSFYILSLYIYFFSPISSPSSSTFLIFFYLKSFLFFIFPFQFYFKFFCFFFFSFRFFCQDYQFSLHFLFLFFVPKFTVQSFFVVTSQNYMKFLLFLSFFFFILYKKNFTFQGNHSRFFDFFHFISSFFNCLKTLFSIKLSNLFHFFFVCLFYLELIYNL